ncbi:hypothetical protein AAMO2058_000306100, partial [Amorphochlora amoebiformis]
RNLSHSRAHDPNLWYTVVRARNRNSMKREPNFNPPPHTHILLPRTLSGKRDPSTDASKSPPTVRRREGGTSAKEFVRTTFHRHPCARYPAKK